VLHARGLRSERDRLRRPAASGASGLHTCRALARSLHWGAASVARCSPWRGHDHQAPERVREAGELPGMRLAAERTAAYLAAARTRAGAPEAPPWAAAAAALGAERGRADADLPLEGHGPLPALPAARVRAALYPARAVAALHDRRAGLGPLLPTQRQPSVPA